MSSVNPKQPGVNPQPWVGIQYVSIPEFQDVGNQCAQLVADYIANRSSVDDALAKCQDIAAKGGDAAQELILRSTGVGAGRVRPAPTLYLRFLATTRKNEESA